MTITVVAEEDWITLVTQVPSATPFSGVLVIRYRNASSLLPATSFRPSPIKDIPNRNNATPESKDKIIENTAIFFSSVAVPSALYFFRNSSFCKVFFYIFLTLFFLIFNLIHIYYAISMTRLQYLIPLYSKKLSHLLSLCICSSLSYKNTICTHISTIRTDFFLHIFSYFSYRRIIFFHQTVQ